MNFSVNLVVLAVVMMVSSVHGAFIVEGHSSGLANGTNFSFGGDTTTASASTPSAAVGLTGSNSLFGGDGATLADTYVFSYTPGTDADNFSPAAGSLLGSTTGFGTETASGAVGGGSGMYNVYWTAPASTNVNALGANFTITGDGASVVVSGVDGNNTGTGPDLDSGPAFVGGANNAWYKLGTVSLTSGTTYSVTQESNANTFVSMRSHAIMWEAVPVPEPAGAGLCLAALASLLVFARRR